MRRQASIPVAAGAALLLSMSFSGRAAAQTAPRAASGSMSHPAAMSRGADQELLRLSAQGNLAEVELGRLAITRSTNPAVRDLGTRLAQDGSRGMASLQTVAAMLHVRLPAAPGATQEGQIAKLSQLHGAAFDKRFEGVAGADESKMLHQFESGVSMARNGAVKSTLQDMIPVVQEHLDIARGIPTREASASKSAMR